MADHGKNLRINLFFIYNLTTEGMMDLISEESIWEKIQVFLIY